MKISVRPFQPHDRPELALLMKVLGYPGRNDALLDDIEEIRKRSGEVFVAESDGKVVGCVCALIDIRLAAGTCGELVSLVVREGYRGSGVGRQLVLNAESWLSRRTDKIRVRANTIRTGAHVFYESLDYQELKSQKIFVKRL